MKDTSVAMEAKFRRMLMKRSGEERLKMGCSMHAASQSLVKAGIAANDLVALKRALFLRFYGDEFGPNERKNIILALRKAAELRMKRDQRSKVQDHNL